MLTLVCNLRNKTVVKLSLDIITVMLRYSESDISAVYLPEWLRRHVSKRVKGEGCLIGLCPEKGPFVVLSGHCNTLQVEPGLGPS